MSIPSENDKDNNEILYNKYFKFELYYYSNIRNGCEFKFIICDFTVTVEAIEMAGLTYRNQIWKQYPDKFSGLYKMMGFDAQKCSIDYFNPQSTGFVITAFIRKVEQYNRNS